MKRTCSWRKQLDGTKPVEAKDRVNKNENCESEEWLQRAIIFMHQTGRLSTWKLCENVHVYSYKTPIKKAQPNFLQTTRKLEIILTLFITVLTISFLLLSTSSASVEFYKLTTLDKMILLAVKVPSSNKHLIFPSILFTDNQWQEAVFEKSKKRVKAHSREDCSWYETLGTPFVIGSSIYFRCKGCNHFIG